MKNLILRTLSGILVIGAVVASLLLGKFFFAALMIVLTLCIMAEFFRMTMGNEYRFSQYLAMFAAVTMFILTFLYTGAKITDITNLGDPTKGHVRLSVQMGGNIWPALWWGARRIEGWDYSPGDVIKLVFRLSRNYYKGLDKVQLTVLDAQKEA